MLKFSFVLCLRILLLPVVVCTVRAVPKFVCRRGTHTQHLAHDDRWDVICFSLRLYSYIFSARLAQWYRQLATLSRLKLCLSVNDIRSLCKQLQAVSVIPVRIVYLVSMRPGICQQNGVVCAFDLNVSRLLAVELTVPVEMLGPVLPYFFYV